MRNWIIKKLGGVPLCEYLDIYNKFSTEILKNKNLQDELKKARRNDHRDERGRFKKADA